MEQEIIEKKAVQRPKKAEKPSMVQYVVSYKLFHNKKFMEEKSKNIANPNNLLTTIREYEQDKVDRAVEALIHVNVPKEELDSAFEKKRKTAGIVITGFFQIPIIMLLLMLCALPAMATPPTQFVAAYYDSSGKKCHVSYNGKTVSVYYPTSSRKELTIIENRAYFTSMPQKFTINGITFTRRRASSARL